MPDRTPSSCSESSRPCALAIFLALLGCTSAVACVLVAAGPLLTAPGFSAPLRADALMSLGLYPMAWMLAAAIAAAALSGVLEYSAAANPSSAWGRAITCLAIVISVAVVLAGCLAAASSMWPVGSLQAVTCIEAGLAGAGLSWLSAAIIKYPARRQWRSVVVAVCTAICFFLIAWLTTVATVSLFSWVLNGG